MASINPGMDNPSPQNRRPVGSSGPYQSEAGELVPNNSLITATPEEGRQLAIRMARLVINAVQPDMSVQKKLRDIYAQDAAMLIQVTHVTAIEFQTIAAANNYWKDNLE